MADQAISDSFLQRMTEWDTGLYLYPLPTGSGKTYSIAQAIVQYRLMGGEKPIIVASPQNKQIEGIYNDLLALTSKEQMDQYVLHIQKNEVCFEDFEGFLESDDAKYMLNHYDECKRIFNDLVSTLKILKQIRTDHQTFSSQTKGEIEQQQSLKFWQFEREFRAVYRKFFREKSSLPHRNPNKRMSEKEKAELKKQFCHAVNAELRLHPWMARLYPCTRIFTCRTFLINTAKFLRPLATVVPVGGDCTLGDYLKEEKPILFLDEFDSNRKVFEDYIIENMMRSEANMIELFRSIYIFLHSEDKWSTAIKESIHAVKETQSLLERSDGLYEKCFSHGWNYRLPIESMDDQNSKYTFFGDYTYHSISNIKGKRYSAAKWSEEKGQYIIRFYGGSEYQNIKNDSDYISIPPMLASLQRFYLRFSFCVNLWSRKYLIYKQRELMSTPNIKGKGIADITYEEAQDSLLRQIFSSTDRSKKIIMAMMESCQMISGSGKRSVIRENDGSYFFKGYWINTFINDSHNMEQTDITFASRVKTPELLCLNLAETMLVIGTSATAEIINPENFYLPFFAKQLGENFSLGNGKELITRYIQQLKDGYKRRGIHLHDVKVMNGLAEFKSTPCNRDTCTLLTKVFNNTAYCKRLAQDLEALYGESNDYYRIGMYYDCFAAMRDFIISPSARAWLFLNSPKLSNAKLQREQGSGALICPNRPEKFYQSILDDAMNELIKEYGLQKDRKVLLINVTSENYERAAENMKEQVHEGARVMVFAAYQTLMTGTNLQFTPYQQDIDDGIYVDIMGNETEKDSPDPRHHHADFDGIFLGRLSGASPASYFSDDESHNDKTQNQNMHHKIGVIKTAAQANVIPEQTATRLVRWIISQMNPNALQHQLRSAFQSSSEYYANLSLKNVVQSIGRISRSFMKNRDISIYIHRELRDNCIRDDLAFLKDKSLLIPELEKLMEHAVPNQSKEQEEQWHFQVVFQNQCAEGDASRFLHNFFSKNGGFKEGAIVPWRDIRQMLMISPTGIETYQPISDWQELTKVYEFLHSPYELKAYSYIEGYDFNYCFPVLERYFSIHDIIKRNPPLAEIEYHCGEVSEEDCKLPLLMSDPLLYNRFRELGYATSWKPAKSIMNPNLYRSFYKGSLGEVCGEAILRKFDIDVKEIDVPELFEKFDFRLPTEIYLDMKHWHYGYFVSRESLLQKVSKKLDEIDAYNGEHHPDFPKAIGIVANLIEENPHFKDDPIPDDYVCFDNHRIYEVPWLFKAPGDYNIKFIFELQRLIKERELHYGSIHYTE